MRLLAFDLLVFAGILLVGLTRLPEPLFGDQALNMLMGQNIAGGGAPYVDLWDLKYPGVFLFFAASGALLGFNVVGIHLFELLWMLGLALLVRVVAGRWLGNGHAATLAPALTVGTYYAITTSYHLTQTEALIGLPLLSSLVAAMLAVRPGASHARIWFFGSGVCAGVVILFKAPYGVLPAVFWVLAARSHGALNVPSAERPLTVPTIRAIAPPFLAGVLLPVGLMLIYLGWKSDLALLWWTFVVHPAEAAQRGGVHFQRFIDGVVWFARSFRVPIILASLGVWFHFRHGFDLLSACLVAWIGLGLLVISIQVISWWPYHYLSLFVPVGLLATRGFETLWVVATAKAASAGKRAIAMTVLLLLGALYLRQVMPIADLLSAGLLARPLPVGAAATHAHWVARYPGYAKAWDEMAFLRDSGSHPGAIYVFGDPNLYLLADRAPAVPLLVWGTSPPVGSWQRLISALEEAAPPYIFVSDEALYWIVEFDPALQTEVSGLRSRIQQRYQVIRTSTTGTWYQRLDLAVRKQ